MKVDISVWFDVDTTANLCLLSVSILPPKYATVGKCDFNFIEPPAMREVARGAGPSRARVHVFI